LAVAAVVGMEMGKVAVAVAEVEISTAKQSV
jgi:hypothetical protein